MGITSLILIIVTATCLVVSLKKPFVGVLGYFIVYMTYNPNTWYGLQFERFFIRPSLVASLFLITGCFINYSKLTWRISRLEMAIYAFMLLLFLVSYLFGVGVEDDNWFYLEKMLKLSIFLFFFIRTITGLDQFNLLIWTIILGAFFLAIQAHQVGTYYDGRLNNIGGTDFGEANAFASFLTVATVFIGFKILKAPLLKKILFIIPVPMMLNGIIMAQSRAVFIGMLVVFLFLLVRAPFSIKKEILIYSLLAIILFGSLTHEQFWERMGTIQDQTSLVGEQNGLIGNNQPLSRIDYWRSSIQIFKDYPMGIGVKNFQKLVSYYDQRNPGLDAHNTYVLCYSEIGIFGILLFTLIIASGFWSLQRIEKEAKRSNELYEFQITSLALSAIFVMYFLGPNVTHSYLYSEFLWILLALPICLENTFIKHKYRIKG